MLLRASFICARAPTGLRFTQKNVSHDNHVNKDNSGKKKLHYYVSRGYFYGNYKGSLHQATSSRRAKKKKATLFFPLGFLHASAGCECAIVKHFVELFNDVYIPRSFSLFQGIELQLFFFFLTAGTKACLAFLKDCCFQNWIKGILMLLSRF